MNMNLPNTLTLFRIACIPLIVVFLWMNNNLGNWAAMGTFVIASVTDYFDGYFARTWKQISSFGKFLDPIADKLLISVALFMLVGIDRIWSWSLIPALIILCREILVSGLREFLAGADVPMPVTHLAKWKTALQMIAIGGLIWDSSAPWGLPSYEIGIACLWISGVLTLITGYDYFKAGLRYIK